MEDGKGIEKTWEFGKFEGARVGLVRFFINWMWLVWFIVTWVCVYSVWK